jgi:hypothetical protein
MSTSAIVLMIVAMLVVWGGLALAIVNLQRTENPESVDDLRRDL